MGTEASISWAQALGWRLDRQLLDPVGSGSAAAVVRRLGAVLAMDESLAELAVRTRRRTSQPDELARALVDGTVVVSYAFRGSMHYLAPEDGGVYLALRAAGRQWELPSWVEHYRLGPADWPDFRAAVREALAEGPLTVPELGRALARHRAYRHLEPVFDDGAGTLVKPLTWLGDMSFGPRRDGQRTFQRLDTNPRWAGIPDLEEAGPRAVTAYLATYGPATPDHLHYWLGQGLSAGRRRIDRWLAELADRLVALDVEGTTALVRTEDADDVLAAVASDAVRFLPGHDQWVMGPGTKDVHVTPSTQRDAVTRKANPVVVGGVVRGTWATSGDRLTVRWLDATRRPPRGGIGEEVDRQAALRGSSLDLTLEDASSSG